MRFSFYLLFSFLFLPYITRAQMIGGSGPGDPSPREVSAGAINEGTVAGSVNTFTGTFDLSHTLGTVSTINGPSFTLTMSYSSSVMTGGDALAVRGVPYGEGWSLNLPTISVSVEDFQKYTSCQLESLKTDPYHKKIFLATDINREGNLYYFNPQYNIPGVGSGKLVYKYSIGDDHHFAPMSFQKPIKFVLSGETWQVTTSDGTIYQFTGSINYRRGPQLRYHKLRPHHSVGPDKMFYNDLYFNEYPNPEVAEWVCSSIRSSTSPERISFKYESYGHFNLFGELEQSCFDEIAAANVSSPFTNTPPKTYVGRYLTEIRSSIEVLKLEYDGDDCVDGDDVDGVFCKKLVYDSDVDGNSWRRYKHVAADGPVSPGDFANWSNPYLISNGNVYERQDVSMPNAKFNHGWLESPILTNFIPGAYYEIEAKISNTSDFICLFDINVASGDNYVNQLEALKGVNNFGEFNFKKTRGWSIHTTFGSPIKWYTRGKRNEKPFKVMFRMPKRYRENGVYLQIGPANSDNKFDLGPHDHLITPQFRSQNMIYDESNVFPLNSYFNHFFNSELIGNNSIGTNSESVNKSLSLYPTDPVPRNFGIGLPWHTYLPFYSERLGVVGVNPVPTLLGTMDYTDVAGTIPQPQFMRQRFWWKDQSQISGINHRPTLAGEKVKLSNVKIYEYKRRTRKLAYVRKYTINGDPTLPPTADDGGLSHTEVSTQRFFFEIAQGASLPGGCTSDPNFQGTSLSVDLGFTQLLKKIVQIPVGTSLNSLSSSHPTTEFQYTDIAAILHPSNPNSPQHESLLGHYVITKMTNPLGKELEVTYNEFSDGAGSDGKSFITLPFKPTPISGNCQEYATPCHPAEGNNINYMPRSNTPIKRYNLTVNFTKCNENGASVYYKYLYSSLTGNADYNTVVSPHLGDIFSIQAESSVGVGFTNVEMVGPIFNLSENYPSTKFEHYTNNSMLWGLLRKQESFDQYGQPLQSTVNTYESTLVFEPGYFRRRNLHTTYDYEEYQSYSNRPSPNSYTNLTSYRNAMMSSPYGQGHLNQFPFSNPSVYSSQKFFYFDFEAPDPASAPGVNPSDYSYTESNTIDNQSSHFIKLVSSNSSFYDYSSCESEGSVNSYDVTTTYEYYECDYKGLTSSNAFSKLPNIGIPNGNGAFWLYWEPSFLPSKVTTSNSASLTGTTEEFFYLWDLKNSNDFIDPSSKRIDIDNHSLLYPVVERGATRPKQDYVFEKRITHGSDGGLVVQSTFYVYSGDIPFQYAETVDVNLDDPDLSCSGGTNPPPPPPTGGNGGGNSEFEVVGPNLGTVIDGECIYWQSDTENLSPTGYYAAAPDPNDPPPPPSDPVIVICRDENTIPLQEPDLQQMGVTQEEWSVSLRAAPETRDFLRVEKVYVQTKKVDDAALLQGTLVDLTGGIDDPDFLVPTLMTAKVHSQNILGQNCLVEDSKGLYTRYEYSPIYLVQWNYCTSGEEVAYTSTMLTPNAGLPVAVIVGEDEPGGQTTFDDKLLSNYTYYDSRLVQSITDPNGIEIGYEYDEFNRLWKTYRNGVLIAENEYSNWNNSPGDNFLQRARKNYVLSKTYLDNDNYNEVLAYVDPLGRSIGEVTKYTSSGGAGSGSTKTSSHYFDIYGRIAASSPPRAGDAPGLTSAALADNGLINFELDVAPRGRALKTAKPGLSTDGDFTVDNQYCLVTESFVKGEIEDAGNMSGSGILPSLSIYMRTVTTDEDGKEVISYTDADGRTVATIAGNGTAATVFDYDERGLLTSYINPKEQEVSIERNYFGYPYQKTSPDEGTMDFSYDYEGKPLTTKDGAGKSTTIKYDRFGRAIAQIDGGKAEAFLNEGMPWVLEDDPRAFIITYTNNVYNDYSPEKIWQYNEFSSIGGDDLASNPPGAPNNNASGALGKLAGCYSFNDSDQVIERRTYKYNGDGFLRQEQVRFDDRANAEVAYSITYKDFYRTGQAKTLEVKKNMSGQIVFSQESTLDGLGRMFRIKVDAPDSGIEDDKIVQYKYNQDNMMVEERRMFGLGGSTIFDQVDYKYDIRDRLTNMEAGIFSEVLSYDNSEINESDLNYNGNINGVSYSYSFSNTPDGQALFSGPTTYGYKYDDFNRLTYANASVGIGGEAIENVDGDLEALGDVSFSYDLIGNITGINRTTLVDELNAIDEEVFSFNLSQADNKIIDVSVSGNVVNEGTFEYGFDGAGNLKMDDRKNISGIIYTRGKYTYSAAGTDYLYDINDARIYKSGPTGKSFYLRNSGGQEIAIIDITSDEPTWYINGLDRVAKIGPEGSLCNPPLCRPDAPDDPGANITSSGMAAIFDDFDPEALTFPATLFRVQLANDEEYYMLDRELSELPSKFNILQQIVIYSEDDFLTYRIHESSSPGGAINIIEFLVARDKGPTTFILNDYHVCDDVCLTDVFQCDGGTSSAQIQYLSDAYDEVDDGQINLNDQRFIYRVRLCGGAEAYVLEEHLPGIDRSFIVVQMIEITSSNQQFEVSINGGQSQNVPLSSLWPSMYNINLDINIDDYIPCTEEPVCIETNKPCNEGFSGSNLRSLLTDIAQDGPGNHASLVYPLDIQRIRFCNGTEFYLLDSEMGQFSDYNYDIVQTIQVHSSTTSIVVEVAGEEGSTTENLFEVLGARANGESILLNNFPDCGEELDPSCIPPICDDKTQQDQEDYINLINDYDYYGTAARTEGLTFPHTFTRVLLCSGQSVYLTEPELMNLPNQSYVIQQEITVTSPYEEFSVQTVDGQTITYTFQDILVRQSILNVAVVGDYLSCDVSDFEECHIDIKSCPGIFLQQQHIVFQELRSQCNQSESIDFPVTLYRIEQPPCLVGSIYFDVIYLTFDEIYSFPGVYNITHVIELDNPLQIMKVLRDGQVEFLSQSEIIQGCQRFNRITGVEYGNCKVTNEFDSGCLNCRSTPQNEDCISEFSIDILDFESADYLTHYFDVKGEWTTRNSCHNDIRKDSVTIVENASINQCAEVTYSPTASTAEVFIAVSQSQRDGGYPIGLVSAGYIRRSYPDLENDLNIDLDEFKFLSEKSKNALLNEILAYILNEEWNNINHGIDIPIVLPQVDISILNGSAQVCISQSMQSRSAGLQMASSGYLYAPFSSIPDSMEAQLSMNLGGRNIAIANDTTQISQTVEVSGNTVSADILILRTESGIDLELIDPIQFEIVSPSGQVVMQNSSNDEFSIYFLDCENPINIPCLNGNCDDICNDLANQAGCTPAEQQMLDLTLGQLDEMMDQVTVADLQFPVRINRIQFCGGIERMVFDSELDQINLVAYRIIDRLWIENESTSLGLFDDGQTTNGTITDLLDIRAGNDDLLVVIVPAPTNSEDYGDLDPVTGQDPEDPILPVTTPVSFYLYDHLGNTRMVVRADNAEAVTVTYAADYFPYGKILREYAPCEPERFLTTQHERDTESGYDNRGARLYDADVGRFLSVDPLAEEFPGWSGYNYVMGNPVLLIDPTGQAPEGWSEANVDLANRFGTLGGDSNVRSDDWIDNGDGTYTAEQGDGAWGLARKAGISSAEAIQLLGEQGYSLYRDKDGVLKVAINPGETIEIRRNACSETLCEEEQSEPEYYRSFGAFLEANEISMLSEMNSKGLEMAGFGGLAQGIGTSLQGKPKINPAVLGTAYFIGTWRAQSGLVSEWRAQLPAGVREQMDQRIYEAANRVGGHRGWE
ncbi:MAG: RHS repeat-associated core domain-containing protein [Bacteroidota bacterium]